jgi:hypothetical protein
MSGAQGSRLQRGMRPPAIAAGRRRFLRTTGDLGAEAAA